ncbi:hypothetical protein [Psychrobacillus sp. FJAT-21963]|uniref:hypothetical protein n=1 Tax=Psychrobacillus sp. FJAT-21963 TaxID=1712028 RepID=UPI0006F3F925|nr:hypothetical protein [Psychrobacillus sp. FJAT-21963]KQL33006.1 hypothetical protein AN959_18185 [Psychrobacillus sp. FJAT-21963]
MVEYIKVSSLVENLSLNITNGSSSTVNVLQWQCIGELESNPHNGVQLTNEEFLSKAMGFLEIVKEKNPDLVLTPEYSFPYKGIERLIMDKTLWPKNGSLFCLGTQGENIDIFKDYLSTWDKNQNTIVLWDAITDLQEEKNFVSPLLYFFVSKETLYILPQIKTGNMYDKWRTFEASYLCLGKKIFVFDDQNSTNKFLSIICADVLHIKAENILENVSGNLTIFHPQLNGNPRNGLFTSFRKEILESRQHNNRIITLNWACDTKIKDTQIIFNKPWSAFYKKHNKNIQGDHRKLRLKNIKLGIFFAYDGINEYWYSDRKENIKCYVINKSDTGQARGPASHGYEPVTTGSYEYISSWEDYRGPFINDELLNAIKDLDDIYLFPIQDLLNSPDKSDFFFGSCLGHFEEGEIKTNEDELVSRMIVGSDEESDDQRHKKLHLFLLLINNLKNGNIPNALLYLKDNHTFTVDGDFPDQGRMIYNLRPKNKVSFENPECLVVITDKNKESKVAQLTSELYEKLSTKLRNQIIVYYQPLGKPEYVFYDKHLDETEIQNPNYTKNMADISNAK